MRSIPNSSGNRSVEIRDSDYMYPSSGAVFIVIGMDQTFPHSIPPSETSVAKFLICLR
jgi:hypothetical protein